MRLDATMKRLTSLLNAFKTFYQGAPEVIVCSPGRINLLGEHTDYNEGFVLPIAVDLNVMFAVRARDDDLVQFYSMNMHEGAHFHLSRVDLRTTQQWAQYVQGVAWSLRRGGYEIGGIEGVIHSTVPIGAGLSSSAALEVAAAWAWNTLYRLNISRQDIALLSQRAEVEFVGVPCGIMDQFIAALGKRGHALCLDCRDLSYSLWPLDRRVRVVACDTNVRRALASSEYAVRRRQCEEAVEALATAVPEIHSLRDVTRDILEGHRDLLSDVLYRRARHVVTENDRVRLAVNALAARDMQALGDILNEAHISLRDDYEVSSPELDAMWQAANEVEGCFGARLTGAGFGGNVVALVHRDALSTFLEYVPRRYQELTGRDATLRPVRAEDGVMTV